LFDVIGPGGNEVLLATLAEVGMPNRLVTSMKNAGVELVGTFVQLTAGDILREQGLGRRSYGEANAILEAYGLSLGMVLPGWDEKLAFEARKAMGRRLHRRLFELRPTVWHPHGALEDELRALLLEVEDERNAEMLTAFFGFNELGPTTLEFTGQQYGLTRERVRQIAARAEAKIRNMWRPMPCLEAIKEIITSQLGSLFTNDDFIQAARQREITNINFHIEGALGALELVGDKQSISKIRIGHLQLFGTADKISIPSRLIASLRKETSSNGCTNVQRLALLIGLDHEDVERVRSLLTIFDEVYWLDSGRTWLLSNRPARNRLANIASKVLSVAPSVEINELRAALRRHVRVNFVPPADALGGLLQYFEFADVIDGMVTVKPSFEKTEIGVNDQGFVNAFNSIGSPATREQLEDFCIDKLGMNINSFYLYLSYCPFVIKLATGVFSLVGQNVTPGAIRQLRNDIKENRFEDTYGWSKAGTLWWHFQADRPTANAGTRPLPTFVFNLTSGEWDVRSFDGLKLGTASIENGFVSGFRTAFLALGVTNKDYIQFDFDIAEREVFVRIAGDDPEEFRQIVEKDEFDDYHDIEA